MILRYIGERFGYGIYEPGELEENGAQGTWEIVEDDDKGSLADATLSYKTIDWGKWRTI